MNIFWIILFILSVWAIAHTYVLYPFLLKIRTASKKLVMPTNKDWPTVEVIMAAYNEISVIEEKVHSVLQCDYPPGKLRITVGSDASTDGTDEVLAKMAAEDPRLQWKRFPGRSGKSAIINELAASSEADILIPTDANIIFRQDVIQNLVRWFQKKEVGAVGATIRYTQSSEKGIAPQEAFYLDRENRIKYRESLNWGMAMGLEGGAYAIRQKAFKAIPPRYFMEDFFQTMQLLSSGKKVLFDPDSVVFEDISTEIEEEFKRKVRISIGNFQNLNHFGGVILKQFWPLGYVFLSHKVLRWLSPFFLLLGFLSTMVLAFNGLFVFQLFAIPAMLLLMLTFAAVFFSKIRVKWLHYPSHFMYMNFALLKGFFTYIKGVKSNVWQPTKRKQASAE